MPAEHSMQRCEQRAPCIGRGACVLERWRAPAHAGARCRERRFCQLSQAVGGDTRTIWGCKALCQWVAVLVAWHPAYVQVLRRLSARKYVTPAASPVQHRHAPASPMQPTQMMEAETLPHCQVCLCCLSANSFSVSRGHKAHEHCYTEYNSQAS